MMQIPIGSLLPAEVGHARQCAAGAVLADRAGDYETAVEMYKKAVRALLKARERVEVVEGGVHEKLLVMAERYAERLKVLVVAVEERDKNKTGGGEEEGDYYSGTESASDGSYSEGELQIASREKLTFKGAALVIMKLLRVPFGFKRLTDNRPQLTCKITKRDFLQLTDLTPSSSTAIKPLYEMGQPHVLWASFVLKRSTFHRRFTTTKVDRRTAVVSPQSFYMGAANELVRCVPIPDIKEILVGNDNWLGMRVPSQYDLLFQPQEQPIQTITTLLDILSTIYKYINDADLVVTRLNDTVEPSMLNLAKPEKWNPLFTPIRVDPLPKS